MEKIIGLTTEQVKQKQKIGLTNEIIDTYSPTYTRIILSNIFSLINVIVIPLLIVLYTFKSYSEIVAFGIMLGVTAITGIIDQANNKRRLDRLRSQFAIKARVIRDGEESIIPASEIVEGDIVKITEGEGIIADGKVIYSNYLQIDESALTGESNYVKKDRDEKVFSGSFVVTGDCYNEVENVGKSNLLNKIGAESLKLKDNKSTIQKFSQILIFSLVFAGIVLSIANFFAAANSFSLESRVLSVTTIISLIIPQTLIFIFSFTFSISIMKLYKKGVLVQKGGSIEQLTKVDTICFDKTGTITTNEMKIVDTYIVNADLKEIGSLYNACKDKLYGVNKTQALLNSYFDDNKNAHISDFFQIPFTSKTKFSLVGAKVKTEHGKDTINQIIIFGAPDKLLSHIEKSVSKKIERKIHEYEQKGVRVLLCLFDARKQPYTSINEDIDSLPKDISSAVIFAIEEELNPSIQTIIENFKDQNINIKIISGDSKNSLSKIVAKVGLEDEEILDLSEIDKISDKEILDATIFARAKPEDKLRIIQILKKNGHFIAMVGDGINDVLSIKAADVGIAMENGAKIARESADMVLLKNDFSKLPAVFYEGDNIIFNLGISTKLFLAKSLFAIIFALFFTIRGDVIPFFPASLLIFSYLSTSLPSYVLIFTRQKVANTKNFAKDILMSSSIASVLFFVVGLAIWYYSRNTNIDFIRTNTVLILGTLSVSLLYSMYLLWESKKVTNLKISIYFYFVLMLIGIMEMVLPVSLNDSPKMLISVAVIFLFASANLIYLLFRFVKPKTLLLKIALIVGSFIWYPFAGLFPVRAYYRVERLPIEQAAFAIVASIWGGIILSLILDSLNKRKTQ